MHPALHKQDHRPWPIPTAPWPWRQSWRDLLFAHWPIEADLLRPLVPESLEVQTFDGSSWIGVVPFHMAGVMRRPLPDLPWISAFPEINLRLYVERDGMPGVWFLSLDATNPLAVWAAKRFFHLPYVQAAISIDETAGAYDYRSMRSPSEPKVEFEAQFEPTSAPYEARAGSLEHWLTERYCLYAASPRGDLYRAHVHHLPWPLQKATAEITKNDLLTPHGLSVAGPPPLTHFSKRIDVVVWSPEKIEGHT